MKIFENGIIVGRFQHIHIGHEKIINIGRSLCDKLLVFIGSVGEEANMRNPYNFEYRSYLINKIYKDEIESGKIILKPLKDLENKSELSPRWGSYVIKNASDVLGSTPKCIIYGKDKDIFKCFDKDTVKNITEILVDRKSLGISATKIREFLANDDRKNWEKYVNPSIYDEYENLKNILFKLDCKN